MKKIFMILLVVLTACNSVKSKKDNNNSIKDESMLDYATLTVTKIQQGKDGYTATLKNDTDNLFLCTISIPNLGDEYVTLNIGDKVKIEGEYTESNPVQIFAKKIYKLK